MRHARPRRSLVRLPLTVEPAHLAQQDAGWWDPRQPDGVLSRDVRLSCVFGSGALAGWAAAGALHRRLRSEGLLFDTEVVVRYVCAYLVRHAQQVVDVDEAELDRTVDAGLESLYELTSRTLGEDPAMDRATQQAAAGGHQISERTRRRLTDALDEAIEIAPALRAELERAVAELRLAEARTGTSLLRGDGVIAPGRGIEVRAEGGSDAGPQTAMAALEGSPAADTDGTAHRERRIDAGSDTGASMRDTYPTLVYVSSSHHADFLQAVRDEDAGAQVAYAIDSAEIVVVLTEPWSARQVKRLRRALLAAGVPAADGDVRQEELTHRPYLVEQLHVNGPDQQPYDLTAVPSTTPVRDIADAVMDYYAHRTPHGQSRRTVIDHQQRDGSFRRLDPGATLHDTGIRDGETLNVYPEATAGGGSAILVDADTSTWLRTPPSPYPFDDRTGYQGSVTDLLQLARQRDLTAAAATLVAGLTDLFLALGPPPEAVGDDLAPAAGGSTGGRR